MGLTGGLFVAALVATEYQVFAVNPDAGVAVPGPLWVWGAKSDLIVHSDDLVNADVANPCARRRLGSAGIYDVLGLDRLGDVTFRALVLARVIEPASKLDTVRVLTGSGSGPRIG